MQMIDMDIFCCALDINNVGEVCFLAHTPPAVGFYEWGEYDSVALPQPECRNGAFTCEVSLHPDLGTGS
jgi:hypothetical protein